MRIPLLVTGALTASGVRPMSGQAADPQPNALSDAERQAGWRLLFDGRTVEGWRGFRKKGIPAGWVVENGALTRIGAGGDIITVKQYRDFELALEWRISEGGNSGIMYRVTEGADATYKTGPEMQVLDDARHPDGRDRLTAAGSAYGLYPAPAGIVRPAGEWNQVRIVARGHHVEHWLNGARVVEYDLENRDWEARVAASKFRQWPAYGRAPKGHIALQDHGDRVEYRSIRIRESR
jgi:hypothetical protein